MKTLRFSGLSLSLITLSAVLLWSTPSFCPLTFGQGSSLKARSLASKADAQDIINTVDQASVGDKDPGVKVLAKHFGATDRATLLTKLRERRDELPDLVAAPAPEAASTDKLVDATIGSAHPAVAAVAAGTAAAGARRAGRAETSAQAAADASVTAAAASEVLKPVAVAAAAGVIPATDGLAARILVLETQLAASVALVAERDASITEKDRQIGEAAAAKAAAIAERDAAAAAAAARIADLTAQLADVTETNTETVAIMQGYMAVMKNAIGGNAMDEHGTLTERAKVIYNAVQSVIDAGVTEV